MIKPAFIALAIAAAFASLTAQAAPVPAQDTPIAREASEGPRGGDNERPGDRQRRGGRYMEEAPSAPMQLAREASEGPRGGDNERPGDRQRRGGRG